MYWLIFLAPASPSFSSASSCGMTTPSSWKMIDAVMYGMIPSANTASRSSAPPANRLRKPNTPAP